MCSHRPLSERLPPLHALLFLPLLAATACGLGSADDGRGASLLNGGMDPDAGTDPSEDAGHPGDNCGDAGDQPPPVDECANYGGICLIADPNGMWPGCPDGLTEIYIGCDGDPNGLSVCCGRSDPPPPADECGAIGGFCAPQDPSGMVVGCPDGTNPAMAACADDGTGLSLLCCVADQPPPRGCEDLGGFCSPSDPNGQIECPEGTVGFPDESCGDAMNGLPGLCCAPSEPPPSEDDCYQIGGFCSEPDPMTGELCPEGSIAQQSLICSDGVNGFSGICCVRDPIEPPPVDDDCFQLGGYCGEIDENMGVLCRDGSVAVPSRTCSDGINGVSGVCCLFDQEPPPGPVCPGENDPNVFYVSQDPAICASISYTCPSNHVVFDSDCGCGCIGY